MHFKLFSILLLKIVENRVTKMHQIWLEATGRTLTIFLTDCNFKMQNTHHRQYYVKFFIKFFVNADTHFTPLDTCLSVRVRSKIYQTVLNYTLLPFFLLHMCIPHSTAGLYILDFLAFSPHKGKGGILKDSTMSSTDIKR